MSEYKTRYGYIVFNEESWDVEDFQDLWESWAKSYETFEKAKEHYLGKWRGDNKKWKIAFLKLEVYG
jgi:hypothetical protein